MNKGLFFGIIVFLIVFGTYVVTTYLGEDKENTNLFASGALLDNISKGDGMFKISDESEWLLKSTSVNWDNVSINMEMYDVVTCECAKNTSTPCTLMCLKLKEQNGKNKMQWKIFNRGHTYG